jgi:hypothetical protein
MGVGAGKVSPLSYHPSIVTFVAVNVGGGRVEIEPVRVYCGKTDGTPPLDIVAGGQGYEALTEAGTFPAPLPPVCHGR